MNIINQHVGILAYKTTERGNRKKVNLEPMQMMLNKNTITMTSSLVSNN
jgi:hypothetical protein